MNLCLTVQGTGGEGKPRRRADVAECVQGPREHYFAINKTRGRITLNEGARVAVTSFGQPIFD